MTCCSVQDVWEFTRESRVPPHELSKLVRRATVQGAAVGNTGDAVPEVQHRRILDLTEEAPGSSGDEMQLPSNVRPSCSHCVVIRSRHAAAHFCWPAKID